jgi:hypothetical protein
LQQQTQESIMSSFVRCRARFLLLACLCAVTAATSPGRAQTLEAPRGRQGYYLGLGGHGALSRSWEEGRADSLGFGGVGTLRLGQKVGRRLGFGLQIDMGSSAGDGQRATLGGLSMAAQWELVGNLAVHGGVGIGFVSLDDTRITDEDTRGGGGAYYLLGASYDWFPRRQRLTGGWSLAPTVQVRLLPGDDLTAGALFAGIDLLYWSGLPRHQLDLPHGQAYQK